MEELTEVRAVSGAGFEDCTHARSGSKRQVLLVDRETLEAMELRPGILRENITTDGLNVNSLSIGQLLRAGEARLEVTAVCALRSDGSHSPRTSQRDVGTTRHAVPRPGWRRHPPRRFHRETFLTIIKAWEAAAASAHRAGGSCLPALFRPARPEEPSIQGRAVRRECQEQT